MGKVRTSRRLRKPAARNRALALVLKLSLAWHLLHVGRAYQSPLRRRAADPVNWRRVLGAQ
jgi:hypothetical protein